MSKTLYELVHGKPLQQPEPVQEKTDPVADALLALSKSIDNQTETLKSVLDRESVVNVDTKSVAAAIRYGAELNSRELNGLTAATLKPKTIVRDDSGKAKGIE